MDEVDVQRNKCKVAKIMCIIVEAYAKIKKFDCAYLWIQKAWAILNSFKPSKYTVLEYSYALTLLGIYCKNTGD